MSNKEAEISPAVVSNDRAAPVGKPSKTAIVLVGSLAGPALRMAGAPVELAAVVTLAWIVGYVIWAYAPVSPPAGKPMEPVAQPSPVVLVQPTPEALRRQRGRSIAIALALGGLVALFYIATIVRLGSNVANRAL